ncbi:MAG: hypothetical protein K8L97_05685 [Anaerolineae bacterium]|nr:hypothetical protein [Anaerolineae bacterium]
MSVQEMIQEARTLSIDERKQLIKALVDMMTEPSTKGTPKQRSLRELRGLGKEIWSGIDAQAYINQGRDEWDRNL